MVEPFRKRRISKGDEFPKSVSDDLQAIAGPSGEKSFNTISESTKKLKRNSNSGQNADVLKVSSKAFTNKRNTENENYNANLRIINRNSMFTQRLLNIVQKMCKEFMDSVVKFVAHAKNKSTPDTFMFELKRINETLLKHIKLKKEVDNLLKTPNPLDSISDLYTLMEQLRSQVVTNLTEELVYQSLNEEVLVIHYSQYRSARLRKMKKAENGKRAVEYKFTVFRMYVKEAIECCEREVDFIKKQQNSIFLSSPCKSRREDIESANEVDMYFPNTMRIDEINPTLFASETEAKVSIIPQTRDAPGTSSDYFPSVTQSSKMVLEIDSNESGEFDIAGESNMSDDSEICDESEKELDAECDSQKLDEKCDSQRLERECNPQELIEEYDSQHMKEECDHQELDKECDPQQMKYDCDYHDLKEESSSPDSKGLQEYNDSFQNQELNGLLSTFSLTENVAKDPQSYLGNLVKESGRPMEIDDQTQALRHESRKRVTSDAVEKLDKLIEAHDYITESERRLALEELNDNLLEIGFEIHNHFLTLERTASAFKILLNEYIELEFGTFALLNHFLTKTMQNLFKRK